MFYNKSKKKIKKNQPDGFHQNILIKMNSTVKYQLPPTLLKLSSKMIESFIVRVVNTLLNPIKAHPVDLVLFITWTSFFLALIIQLCHAIHNYFRN